MNGFHSHVHLLYPRYCENILNEFQKNSSHFGHFPVHVCIFIFFLTWQNIFGTSKSNITKLKDFRQSRCTWFDVFKRNPNLYLKFKIRKWNYTTIITLVDTLAYVRSLLKFSRVLSLYVLYTHRVIFSSLLSFKLSI